MHNLLQVRYRHNQEGLISDVALNELILSNKIKQFYRPSESRWVDVGHDSIRVKSSAYNGPERREAKKTAKKGIPVGLISRFFRRKVKEKPLSAEEWFERGFSIMYTTGNWQEAIQAFSSSIQLDPANASTYLNRGIAYERICNAEQAIDDYSKAIELSPNDAKAYYVRGELFWRLEKCMEGICDIKISTELGYKPAKDFLNHKSIPT